MSGKRRFGYILGIVIPIVATALRLVFLQELGTKIPYVLFYPAVVFASLYDGLRAGLLSAVVSALLVDYF